jgi:hypothetical protein
MAGTTWVRCRLRQNEPRTVVNPFLQRLQVGSLPKILPDRSIGIQTAVIVQLVGKTLDHFAISAIFT